MAEGFALNVDTNFLNNLDKADKKMKDIIETSQKMSKVVIESFKEANSNGLKTFIENLNGVNKALGSKSKPIVFKDISTQVTQAADKVNSFITLMNKINNVDANRTRNSAVTKINEELEIAKKRLGELQNLLNFYTKGEGQKAIGFVDTTASQKEARALMNQIDLLERQKASLQANARLRMTLAQQQEARDNAWAKMQNDKDRREAESAKRASQYAKKYSEDYRKSYEERYRAYEAMFDKIEGKENRRRSAQDLFNQGTVLYNSVYDKSGYKSVENMRNALSQMQNAQSKLNLNTEQGRKKYAEMDVIIKQVQKDIDKATGAQEQFRNKSSKLVDTMGQLRRSLALLFSVSQITGYMNKLVQVRKEMELQQRSLQVLLQNKDEANKLWQQTVDLAVRSPFRVKELVTYTRQLAAYRIETDKLHDTTKRLADVSAGLGVDMQRLILAFGQVRAANYLRGTELRQFTEAGIPMLDELAKHFSELEGKAISAGDVFEMISKRMVSFADVEAVFRRMTDAGGVFYNMQEEQSKTLAGMISNLHDSIDLMLNDIGQAQDGVLKGTVNVARVFVQNWESMAVAIKGVLIALAGYKLYQLAIKEANIQTAASMGLVNAAATKQLTMAQLLKVGWSNLGKTMAATGATMKSVLAFNLPLLIGGAIITGIAKLVSTWNEHKEQLEDIGKEYDDLRKKIEVINVKFNLATDENDFKEQKNKLNELVTLANNDYHMKIKVDVEGMNAKEIQEKFNEISQQLFDANIFAEHFAKVMQEATKYVVEDDIFKDLEQLGTKSTELLHELSLNRERVVFSLQKAQNELTTTQLKALEKLSQPKGLDESEVEYLNRIREGYSLLMEDYKKYQKASSGAKTERERYKWIHKIIEEGRKLKDLGIDASNLTKYLGEFSYAYDEAKKEFFSFVKNINLDKNLSAEQKEIRLKTAIDKQAAQKGWNDFVKDYVMKWTEKKFKITFEVVPQEKDPLKAWQETYNEMFRGFEGFKEITQNTEKQTAVIERLNENYKTTKDLIDRINKAGGVSATLSGGAYEGENLDELTTKLEQVQKQIDWFGAETEKAKKSNKESINAQISLIKEMRKEYEDLNKIFDKTTSQEKVMTSYAEAFRRTFEGVGLSLQGKILDSSKIEELKKVGEISDEVAEKLNELQESGTHIRSYSDDALSDIKYWEGFRANAYNIGDGRWTIGYGETQGVKQGDTITQEEADAKLRKHLTEDFVVSLNKVLDANKDIIVTQEQYNALLSLTYQGGGGAVSRLFQYAKDEEKAIEHIQSIHQRVKEVFGEQEAERFGEAFVNKFKESESIYERIAMLLQTMNITINGGKIDKSLYQGMQKRSDARAEIFSYGKELNDIFEKAVVDFSDLDITDVQGVVAFLEKLRPYAQQKGKEAMDALEKVIASYKVEIGSNLKVEEDKALIDQIEDMFSGYELSLELEKLNIPPDLAKQLFNLDTLSLPELKDKVLSMQSQFVGTDMEEDYRKFLKKISEMEDKERVENLKKYSKYLLKTQSERVKIKLEEIRQIQEIEKLNIDEGLKNQMKQGVRDETQQALDKEAWESFKNTDLYVQMFEDLGVVSNKVLSDLKERLTDMRGSLNDLSPTELKEIVAQLEKVTDEQISRNPFENFGKNMKDGIDALKRLKKEQEAYNNALKNQKSAEDEVDRLQVSIATAKAEKEKANAIIESKDATEEQVNEAYRNLIALDASITADEALLELAIQRLAAEKGITDEAARKLIITRQEASAATKTLNSIGQKGTQAVDSIQNLTGMLENWGVEFGEEFKEVLSGVGQMFSALESIDLSKPMSIITGSINFVAGLGNSLASIFGFGNKDKKKEKQIQREIKFVEDLERAYEKLEKQIDEAYTIDTLKRSYDNAQKNLDEQIAARQRMIALEEDKKKTDSEKIKQYQQEIEDLREQQEELLKTQVEELGGGYDYSSMTEEFVDAWLSAYEEAGDGLKGLEDNFDDFFKNIAIKQAVMGGASKILEPFFNEVNKALEDDFKLDDSEMAAIERVGEQAKGNLDVFMKQWYGKWGEYMGGEGQGDLSGLQRGIQQLTESTGQELAAYLNSIRFFVSEQNVYLSQIANYMTSPDVPNPMLSELRTQTELVRGISTLLNSLTAPHPTQSGRGLKVII